MKTYFSISCAFLLLMPGAMGGQPLSLAEAEAALVRVQQQYEGGVANHADVLVAERVLLRARMESGSFSHAELLAAFEALDARWEDYHRRHLEAGVADILFVTGERIAMQKLRLELLRRSGKPLEEARARLRSLYEEMLRVRQRQYRGGQCSVAELEAARRELVDFLKAEYPGEAQP